MQYVCVCVCVCVCVRACVRACVHEVSHLHCRPREVLVFVSMTHQMVRTLRIVPAKYHACTHMYVILEMGITHMHRGEIFTHV